MERIPHFEWDEFLKILTLYIVRLVSPLSIKIMKTD